MLRATKLKRPEAILLEVFTQCKKAQVLFQLLSQTSQTAWLRGVFLEINEIC